MEPWNAVFRFARIAFVILGIALVGYIFYPQVTRWRELKERELKLEEEVRFNDQRLRHLRDKQGELMNDPRKVERIARDQLGLAKPGETIYKFGDQPATNPPRP